MNHESIILEMLERIQTLEKKCNELESRLNEFLGESNYATKDEINENNDLLYDSEKKAELKYEPLLKITTKDIESLKITTKDIESYILDLIKTAKNAGQESVELLAKDIHNDLKLVSRYPMVCNAMRKCMKENDIVVYSPKSGYSSTLRIRYLTNY